MNPMNLFRGLVSTLHHNLASLQRRAALASTRDTSRHHDKVPVLTQAYQMSSAGVTALFYPGRLIRNRITASAGNARSVSPCLYQIPQMSLQRTCQGA